MLTLLADSREVVIETVRSTYLNHEDGLPVNPDSYFLRFSDKHNSRVIALPAYLCGDVEIIGIKWIDSFPDNVARGVPRASAVLLLNDSATGLLGSNIGFLLDLHVYVRSCSIML